MPLPDKIAETNYRLNLSNSKANVPKGKFISESTEELPNYHENVQIDRGIEQTEYYKLQFFIYLNKKKFVFTETKHIQNLSL